MVNFAPLTRRCAAWQEEREYVLGLRRMALPDGNDYAVGTYKMGEWFAKRVNDLIAETGIPKVLRCRGLHHRPYPALCCLVRTSA